ncbi:hypothetical protein ACWEK5_46075 [Rhodococcus koreensis]
MIVEFLSVSSIPARRRGGDPKNVLSGTDGGGRERTQSPTRQSIRLGAIGQKVLFLDAEPVRPNPVCLVCMGVDVDDGFSDSTYQ